MNPTLPSNYHKIKESVRVAHTHSYGDPIIGRCGFDVNPVLISAAINMRVFGQFAMRFCWSNQ